MTSSVHRQSVGLTALVSRASWHVNQTCSLDLCVVDMHGRGLLPIATLQSPKISRPRTGKPAYASAPLHARLWGATMSIRQTPRAMPSPGVLHVVAAGQRKGGSACTPMINSSYCSMFHRPWVSHNTALRSVTLAHDRVGMRCPCRSVLRR